MTGSTGVGGGVYPGWGPGGYWEGAIPGYYPDTLPGPIFSISEAEALPTAK